LDNINRLNSDLSDKHTTIVDGKFADEIIEELRMFKVSYDMYMTAFNKELNYHMKENDRLIDNKNNLIRAEKEVEPIRAAIMGER
jgi:hypothetical protein